MNIGIIGSGNVGSALGKGWVRAGHKVKYGVRDMGKEEVVALLKELGPSASAGSVGEAASFGEVVVLTVPFTAAEAAIKSAGNLANKVVIDCTNPVKSDLSGLTVGHNISAGEQVAGWTRGARVVKCFNTTGAPNMLNPQYGSDRLVMFLAGDDASAKKTVAKLTEEIGFEAVDAGALEIARLLEPVAMLWIHLAVHQKFGPNFGYTLVKRV